jgi:hypothetical protein
MTAHNMFDDWFNTKTNVNDREEHTAQMDMEMMQRDPNFESGRRKKAVIETWEAGITFSQWAEKAENRIRRMYAAESGMGSIKEPDDEDSK